jgi:6,7-dimethyl-8-ribityllumazine synthase
MADIRHSRILDTGIPGLRDACVVIVRTQWNAVTVDVLESGCRESLIAAGLSSIPVITVPGAVEIPFAVRRYWETHQDEPGRPAAFITLGCVLRGETPHFEWVCKTITDGVLQLNLILPVPVIFGVLTVDNAQQAADRSGGSHGHKGKEAAATAIQMIGFNRSLNHPTR